MFPNWSDEELTAMTKETANQIAGACFAMPETQHIPMDVEVAKVYAKAFREIVQRVKAPLLTRITELENDCEMYEAMKEGVQMRIADLEAAS